MKVIVYRTLGGWVWSIFGRSGTLHATSIATYNSKKSCLRTVRRLFGKTVKVEVL